MKNRPIKNNILAVLVLLVLATAGAALTAGELPGPAPSGDTGDQAPATETDDTWSDEEWEEDEGPSRSFLFKELVMVGLYSFDGVTGVPMGDMNEDHFEASHRPPHNYLGLDYVKTFSDASKINKILPKWLPLTAMDLHPRIVYDQMELESGTDRLKFAPQDFWLRFNPGHKDRLILRMGQFVLPFGMNPVLAPRQRFLLPLEATDMGLKWDWGLDLKGPAGGYEWEMAATIGSGEALHSTHLLSSEKSTYLVTGRFGAPTYWDYQNGFSFLYGNLPMVRGPAVLNPTPVSRWRIGYDTFHKHGTYLMTSAQVIYGEDEHEGMGMGMGMGMAGTSEVFGFRTSADYVVPKYQGIRLAAQFETLRRDLSMPNTHDTAAILEIGYSFTTNITAIIAYRDEINRSMGENNDAIYVTFVYYGR